MNELAEIIKSIFESRYLKRVERSGTSLFLGNEIQESVVEHSFFTCLWALVISHLNPSLDLSKLLTMCLIHDLEEVRIGDLNQINRSYFTQDPEIKAFSDMWKRSQLGKKLTGIHKERHAVSTPESQAAYDADVLSELILEKEYLEKGVKEAKEWIEFTIRRLKTKEGKKIAAEINRHHLAEWWEEAKNAIRKRHGLKPVSYRK
ncbi:MAG TPA: HD domain-containing protein [Candidatus Bathyarchaeia archaeon]|nr:HD domain-containing protein [Candidatus Bathyarchaeia archaeon]